jgi:dipeptidyl aminopeptidase/acylaminoacyl peptidase
MTTMQQAESERALRRDIRQTPLYVEAERLFAKLTLAGTGRICDGAEIHVAPDGKTAVFAGVIVDVLEGPSPTRICTVDVASGKLRVASAGPHTDKSPKFSPDGRSVAFLSDRHAKGDFQLYLLDPVSGQVSAARRAAGWVEHFQWSSDGRQVLLGVAEHGADVSGVQGAESTDATSADPIPSWMPLVKGGNQAQGWRRAWIYNVDTGVLRSVGPPGINCWESVWCGDDAIAVVASSAPDESAWYGTQLQIISLETNEAHVLFRPEGQLGWASASPAGHLIAVVEAICSDRGLVAGEVRVIERVSGNRRFVDTHGVDVAHCEWRTDNVLLLAGHRGFDSVVGLYDVRCHTFTQIWRSDDITSGGNYLSVCGIGAAGDFALVAEGFTRAPEIGVVRAGGYTTIASLNDDYSCVSRGSLRQEEQVCWSATDGSVIQGWLLRPHAPAPHPLVVNFHGGPVWHWRPRWLGRSGIHWLMLLDRGYAIFLPNPRGSTGRGPAFVRAVLGDIGGVDARDNLCGIDHLVDRGIADPARVGAMGVSYGGYMTCWLSTQTARLAAAVAIAPITNHVTEYLLSNIPYFSKLFVGGSYAEPSSHYFKRSPVMHAKNVRTAMLSICGARDQCTPPEEAMQWHRALITQGAESVLVTYPDEGHGVRRFPATIDVVARIVGWLHEHLSMQKQET